MILEQQIVYKRQECSKALKEVRSLVPYNHIDTEEYRNAKHIFNKLNEELQELLNQIDVMK